MPLYSLRNDSSGDTITKFDSFGNPEATYRVTPGRPGHCDCPAGQRPTCRHRQMLPYLRPYANSPWFLDWDGDKRIVDFQGIPKSYHDLAEEPAQPAAVISPTQLDLPHLTAEPSVPASSPTPAAPSWRRL